MEGNEDGALENDSSMNIIVTNLSRWLIDWV